MALKQTVMQRVLLPAGIKVFQLTGDPLARMLLPKYRENPYPLYAEMRQRSRVRNPYVGVSATTRHAEVTAVLRDNDRFGHDLTRLENRTVGPKSDLKEDDSDLAVLPTNAELLLMQDPPDHTRIRRLVGKAFSPKAIAELEPWIEELANDLVEQAARRAEADGKVFDLVEELAFPLPLAVICRMLGVPTDRREDFRAWGEEVGKSLDFQLTSSDVDSSERAAAELAHYLKELIDTHRSAPSDDLLSALIAAEEEGDKLSSRELLATCLLLLVAGFETTVNLIGNATNALLNHPDEWKRLQADPELVGGAVEEALRYDSPVQLTSRVSYETMQLAAGTEVRRGEELLLLLGGANRDPAVFEDPERFDITRANAKDHVSFSTGIHHCLGASLARMEGRAALRALTRFDGLAQAARPKRRSLMVLRGFESMPLTFGGLVA